jgi:septum formation protein
MIGLIGVPMVGRSASIDESPLAGEGATEYLERILRAKLRAIGLGGMREFRGALVADTVVIAPDGELVGKPSDDQDAAAILMRLGGATHEVTTRFLLAEGGEREGDVAHAETVTTRVTFRELFPGELQAYVATGEGRDKAGAYAVQGGAAAFVERIDGSYTNVVGLPLSEVVVAMRRLGWL